jgi:hypothetical protein
MHPCSVDDIKHALSTFSPTELNALRQRPGFNALYDIDCGGDPYGAFSMIHTEGLHALEDGIMEYALEILFDKLNINRNINWTVWSNALCTKPANMVINHSHALFGPMV